MRPAILAVLVLTIVAPSVSAQDLPLLEIGPVVRRARVSFEGNASGSSDVAGIAMRVAISRHWGVSGEITAARRDTSRAYEGYFISYATPPATREEFERLGVYARRALTYAPGAGGSVALTLHGNPGGRIDTVLELGASFRRYVETSDMKILRVPDGIDPSRAAAALPDARRDRLRSGFLIGLAVPVALTRRLVLSPELRYVWGGPAQIGSKYRELGFGARASWRF